MNKILLTSLHVEPRKLDFLCTKRNIYHLLTGKDLPDIEDIDIDIEVKDEILIINYYHKGK